MHFALGLHSCTLAKCLSSESELRILLLRQRGNIIVLILAVKIQILNDDFWQVFYLAGPLLSYGISLMAECRTVRHPDSPELEWKKLMMPEPVRYRTKTRQSGSFLLQYRSELMLARMTLPALVARCRCSAM
jgi:hypothetical protein